MKWQLATYKTRGSRTARGPLIFRKLDLRGGGRRYSPPQSACSMIDVGYWPLADIPIVPSNVRFLGKADMLASPTDFLKIAAKNFAY